MILNQYDCGELTVITARSPTAPYGEHQSPGTLSCLLGYAVDNSGCWLDARSVFEIWNREGDGRFGGYFAAATYSTECELTIGCDLLGFFPVYYTECNGVLMAGSSPELMTAHPSFNPQLDVTGLAGILMTNGLMGNRPLFQGVRRLRSGSQLRWKAKLGVREVEVFSLSAIPFTGPISSDHACELADAELSRAIRWHRPRNTPSTLMLSGGLDFRLMAAYLVSEGITDSAVGLGRPTDLEVQVGARAAAAIGWKFHREIREPDPSEFAAAARHLAGWEHLAGGFSHLDTQCSANIVGKAAPMFWSGFSLEDVLGGDAFLWGCDAGTGHWSFETILEQLNTWGVPLARMPNLLRTSNAREIIADLAAGLQHDYNHGSGPDSQRATLLKLLTRARFHIGSVIHRLSFRSWPLLPLP
jgi:hypothetical protein